MKLRRIIAAVAVTVSCAAAAAPLHAEVAGINEPGSFLVFAKFDWRSTTRSEFRITNTHDSKHIGVKVNYLCPGVFRGDQRCRALDRTIVLTPHETRIIDVGADQPPCRRGFAVAYALQVDAALRPGGPISFNYLQGSWHVSGGRRLESENAAAFQSAKSEGSPLGGGSPLRFAFNDGGGDYLPTGGTLYSDFRAPDANGTAGSRLILLTLDTRAGQQNISTSVYVDFWNAVEVPFSTSHEYVCWDEIDVEAIDENFYTDALGTVEGSFIIGALPNCFIPGACPPFNWVEPAVLGALSEQYGGASSVRNLSFDSSPKPGVYFPR